MTGDESGGGDATAESSGGDAAAESSGGGSADAADEESQHPIEGQIVMLAGAKASVPVQKLPDLLGRANEELLARREAYERTYEQVHAADGREYYAAEAGHWVDLGIEGEFSSREADAVRRAHEEQFLRAGRRADRREEFETTLDIRDVVVMAETDDSGD